jgi:glycolate oxidase iron-sulfur subunit
LLSKAANGHTQPHAAKLWCLGNEMDSPRGRIYLMRSAAEGRVDIGESFTKHMNLCLVCRACESACPSGVQYGSLIEAARGQIERKHTQRLSDRIFRKFVLDVFTDRRLLGLLLGLFFYEGLFFGKGPCQSGFFFRYYPH